MVSTLCANRLGPAYPNRRKSLLSPHSLRTQGRRSLAHGAQR